MICIKYIREVESFFSSFLRKIRFEGVERVPVIVKETKDNFQNVEERITPCVNYFLIEKFGLKEYRIGSNLYFCLHLG